MQVCNYASMQVYASMCEYNYASMQVCKYAICKYASMWVSKYASIHAYASMQVCKYESMQEDIWFGNKVEDLRKGPLPKDKFMKALGEVSSHCEIFVCLILT